eukprot:1784689-Pleurochrysis_carterae.AAC.2
MFSKVDTCGPACLNLQLALTCQRHISSLLTPHQQPLNATSAASWCSQTQLQRSNGEKRVNKNGSAYRSSSKRSRRMHPQSEARLRPHTMLTNH